MGKLKGHRQVTLYVNSELYERVRCTAYFLGEDIYEFVSKAFIAAVDGRVTKDQKSAIDVMAKQNIKNNGPGRTRRPAL